MDFWFGILNIIEIGRSELLGKQKIRNCHKVVFMELKSTTNSALC
jgi:hypothetical protein